MSILLAFPVFLVTLMLQTVIVNRLPLLHGSADLFLLILVAWALQERVRTAWIWAVIAGLLLTYMSAMPLYLPLIWCLVATGIARLLQRQVWQTPILSLLVAVVVATLVQNILSIAVLQFFDSAIPWRDGLSLVTLPSLLLNLLLAFPVFTFVADMANWVYPPLEE